MAKILPSEIASRSPRGNRGRRVVPDQGRVPTRVGRSRSVVRLCDGNVRHSALGQQRIEIRQQSALDGFKGSFVGSHFFYEDVSGRSIADDTHELLKTT